MKVIDILSFRTLLAALVLSLMTPLPTLATTVQVQTTAGDFVINLFDFDKDVRATVDNFLLYVKDGRYNQSYFHRLAKGFVIQGGGYIYDGTFPAPEDRVPAGELLDLPEVILNPGEDNPMVDNQPKYSNVRGTVTMAKIGGQPDSASNQWFVNLANNGGNLDIQNEGFTVFGIVESGMDVVEALAEFNLLVPPAEPDDDTDYTYQDPLTELPLQNYDNDNYAANEVPNDTNLAMITGVVVLNPAQDTASGLDIVINERILGYPQNPIVEHQDFKDGGSVGFLFLFLLATLLVFRRKFYHS